MWISKSQKILGPQIENLQFATQAEGLQITNFVSPQFDELNCETYFPIAHLWKIAACNNNSDTAGVIDTSGDQGLANIFGNFCKHLKWS